MAEQKALDFDRVEAVVDAFGGVRPMATAVGVPASTVQGWKERGAIPKARHKEVTAAFAAQGQASAIPVDHAIDAAAGMVDKIPPEADKQTRNYQPPRSEGARTVNPQGSSNLVLSLILVALAGILGLLLYQFLQGVRGNDVTQMVERFAALEARVETLDQGMGQIAGAVAGLDAKIETVASAGDAFLGLNDRFDVTTSQVEAVSAQLSRLAADVEARSEAQAQTISQLSLAQTALFESLSQDMVAQMTDIAENLDQSVTDQMTRLEDRAAAAREEATRQQDIAIENEQRARAAAAEARAAEAAMAAGIRDVATVTQLRLALAEHQPFAQTYRALDSLSEASADIAVAQGALGEYANGAFGRTGVPTEVQMVSDVDALIALDQQAIRDAAGFGAARIPASDDETQNQGKLAAARRAIITSDLALAGDLLRALDGAAREASDPLLLALDANTAAETAKQALDRWIAFQVSGN